MTEHDTHSYVKYFREAFSAILGYVEMIKKEGSNTSVEKILRTHPNVLPFITDAASETNSKYLEAMINNFLKNPQVVDIIKNNEICKVVEGGGLKIEQQGILGVKPRSTLTDKVVQQNITLETKSDKITIPIGIIPFFLTKITSSDVTDKDGNTTSVMPSEFKGNYSIIMTYFSYCIIRGIRDYFESAPKDNASAASILHSTGFITQLGNLKKPNFINKSDVLTDKLIAQTSIIVSISKLAGFNIKPEPLKKIFGDLGKLTNKIKNGTPFDGTEIAGMIANANETFSANTEINQDAGDQLM